uniref:DNA 5'-3' helicase n=1 Tax=candidate division WOR-3 bacterium TaxID=2052148 RepID=A0A7C6A818_UNCW3
MLIEERIKIAFSKNGDFSRILPDFEERAEQTKMALAVFTALNNSHHLMVEAGTGVGKSLAYCLPVALWSKANKKRVVVSTYTKLLQNQLIKKDLPILKSILGDELSVAVIYGQENYLCLRRLNASINYGLFDTFEQAAEINEVLEWSKSGSGILAEYPAPLSPNILERIGRDSDNCFSTKCPFHNQCFYLQAKKRWQQADILVVNHYLFFANAEADYHILPKFDAIIFDEAHRLEEVVAHYFGIELSNYSILRLLSLIYNPRTNRGIIPRLVHSRSKRVEIGQVLDECHNAVTEFFAQIRQKLSEEEFKRRIKEPNIVNNNLDEPLKKLYNTLSELKNKEDDPDLVGELISLTKRTEKVRQAIARFLDLEDKNSVYWIEAAQERISLNSALIDCSRLFADKVFNKFPSVIMTSATLTVNRDFSFLKHRFGANNCQELLLDSPFNYQRQTLLYLAQTLPLPNDEDNFYTACARMINEILKLSQGRALILFTSYQALKAVYERMKKDNFTFLIQGEAPVFKLLETFREDVSSVLLATQSFWQGVDVPGEALSCLIITRLPFDVPDDPRLEGVTESLREQGRDPFYSFQLPQAVLRFRQGFGRLIRNTKDRGVVCVLDKRIVERSYGKFFLESLPKKLPMTFNINAIAQFFKNDKIANKNFS